MDKDFSIANLYLNETAECRGDIVRIVTPTDKLSDSEVLKYYGEQVKNANQTLNTRIVIKLAEGTWTKCGYAVQPITSSTMIRMI